MNRIPSRLIFLSLAISSSLTANIINIPAEYATIQAGIDAAVEGDTVLVQPGTYVENINFNGKNIVVGSLFIMCGDPSYISQTVIDGNQIGSVVTFENMEDSNAMLIGFTLTKGMPVARGLVDCGESASSGASAQAEVMNPFSSHIQDHLHWYGSGDANEDNVVDERDLAAMQNGAENYMADVDGDGTPSTASDQEHLQDYLDGNINYLQGWWDYLETRGERESWLEKTLVLSFVDTIPPRHSAIYELIFNSAHRAALLSILNDFDKSNNLPLQYIDWLRRWGIDAGIFNIPIWYSKLSSGHNMNAVLVGNDPTKFSDWSVIEPQNDSINVQPGDLDLPENIEISFGEISSLYGVGVCPDFIPVIAVGIKYYIDSTGNADSIIYQNPDLLLERPDRPDSTVAVIPGVSQIPSRHFLGQNYPNPFNPTSTIQYELPEATNVTLVIYDILGREVITLVDQEMQPGYHATIWDARNKVGRAVPTGIYIAMLVTPEYTKSIKMLLLK